MEKIINSYNGVVGAVITLLTAVLGAYWFVFVAYLFLNVCDWLTGWYKARKLKRESSAVGLKGILKKLGYWVIIAVAFLISAVFIPFGKALGIDLSFLSMIGYFTLACLLVNEVRSIVENLVEARYNVPAVLTKGLKIMDKLINQEEEEKNDEKTSN